MYKRDNKLNPIVPPMDSNGKVYGLLNVDQYPAQDFNRGVNGFTANDLTLLSRATTLKESEMILSRLNSIRANNPELGNMSDKELLRTIKPSWVQTPSEIERFAHFQAEAIERTLGQKAKESDSSSPSSVLDPGKVD